MVSSGGGGGGGDDDDDDDHDGCNVGVGVDAGEDTSCTFSGPPGHAVVSTGTVVAFSSQYPKPKRSSRS